MGKGLSEFEFDIAVLLNLERMIMKTVVVTGAAGGMGASLCRLLVERNHRVIGIDHNADRLACLEKELPQDSFISVQGELASESLFAQLQQILEKEDVIGLVNMAGVSKGNDIENINDEDWEYSLQVNLSAPMKLSRLVSQFMKEQGGSIVNVSSPVGFIGARKVSYAASKAGLLGLTMATAKNLGKYNIRCNLLLPGTCITYMTQDWSEAKRKSIGSESFLGRLCTPIEVAKGVCFLLSDESSYMTGSVLDLTGGSMVGH